MLILKTTPQGCRIHIEPDSRAVQSNLRCRFYRANSYHKKLFRIFNVNSTILLYTIILIMATISR